MCSLSILQDPLLDRRPVYRMENGTYVYSNDPFTDYHPNPPHVELDESDSNFKMMLNVNQFQPDEIVVKTVDDHIVVIAQHEEHADEHGFVSREFTRRYKIPHDVEAEKLTAYLSKNGVLTIEAPRKIKPPPKIVRVVPVVIERAAINELIDKPEERQQEQLQQQKSTEN